MPQIATLQVMEKPSNYDENGSKLNHPHDKMFKETFGDLEVAKDFIKHYLPAENLGIINVDTLCPLKDSFIEDELKDIYADLLFSAELDDEECYFYFLFEHKSYKERTIAFDLYDYIGEIWRTVRNKQKSDSVPFVIPIVFYHGRSEWKDVKTIADLTQGFDKLSEDMQLLSPSFKFYVIDMSLNSNTEIMGNPKLQAYLKLVKHIYDQEEAAFYQALQWIEQLLINYDEKYLYTVFIYIHNARESIDLEEVKKHLLTKGGERMVSMVDQVLRREREEGIEEGKVNFAYQTARKLLRMGMDKDEIKEITELRADEIAKIKAELSQE